VRELQQRLPKLKLKPPLLLLVPMLLILLVWPLLPLSSQSLLLKRKQKRNFKMNRQK
jgi:hypothetical protein